MPYIRNGLVQSLVTADAPAASQSRLEQLRSNPSIIRRTETTFLHGVARRHPAAIARILGLDYQPTTLPFVGLGCQSIVLRSGENEVTKIIQRSMWLSPTVLAAEADRKNEEYLAMAEHLGSYVLPQTIFIDTHPLFTNRQVIQIRQPYREVTDPLLFQSPVSADMEKRLAAMRSAYPDSAASLGDYADRSRQLYKEYHLLPDTIGHKNLVVMNTDALLMIDGQPTTAASPMHQAQILQHLDQLETLLTAA